MSIGLQNVNLLVAVFLLFFCQCWEKLGFIFLGWEIIDGYDAFTLDKAMYLVVKCVGN